MAEPIASIGTRVTRAVATLRTEAKGDWYRDPWGWPEYRFLQENCAPIEARMSRLRAPRGLSKIVVPKENFGVRPAVVLDIIDRVTYQLLVDRISLSLIGDLGRDVYGWRLIPGSAEGGKYARNGYQWANYRSRLSRLAAMYDVGMKADIASFFASIDPRSLFSGMRTKCPDCEREIEQVEELSSGWQTGGHEFGIPQRSTASAVLANGLLMDLDQLLREVTGRDNWGLHQPHRYVRWMDDVWMFGSDEGSLRSAQVEIQKELMSIGLSLNSAKTKVYEGEALIEATRKIQISAIKDAYRIDEDTRPLEELVDELLDLHGADADASRIRFACSRMRRWKVKYRLDDFLRLAPQMPHAAASIARVFRDLVPAAEIEEWLLEYSASRWNCFQWSLAQYVSSLPAADFVPRRPIVELLTDCAKSDDSSAPMTAAAMQRLAFWNRALTRELIRHRIVDAADPLIRRILCLTALSVGENVGLVRKWIGEAQENDLTRAMLEDVSFAARAVRKYYV